MRLAIMFVVALFFIDAALLGNIGSIVGAVVDPANMVDVNATSASSTGSGGTSSSPSGASGGF